MRMTVRWPYRQPSAMNSFGLAVDDYVDYDSDYGHKTRNAVEADPYAGEYNLVLSFYGV